MTFSSTTSDPQETGTEVKPVKEVADAMARLTKATDAVDATLRAAEEYLAGLNIESKVSVLVFSHGIAPEHSGAAEIEYPVCLSEEMFLCYERVGERFRLTLLKERSTVADEEFSTSFTILPSVPWDHAGRKDRVSAAAKLPELFEELAKWLDVEAEVAENASKKGEAFLGGLQKVPLMTARLR
jgi:hypothetical protein